MAPRRGLGALPALLTMNLKASLALRGAFWLQAAFMLLNNLIFFVTWWVFFGRFDEVRGWRIEDVGALYAIVAGGFGLTMILLGGVRQLALRIASGDLDAYLTVPTDPLLHVMASRSQAFGWGDLASAPVFLVLFDVVTPAEIPLVVIAVLCAATVLAATGVLAHSLAFWLGDVDSLTRQVFEMTLAFSVYPRTLFSGVLKVLLFTLLPAGFIGYLPVELLRAPSVTAVLAAIGGAALYAVAAWLVFRAGLARYASGSQMRVRA